MYAPTMPERSGFIWKKTGKRSCQIFKMPRNPAQTEAPDCPVGRSLAGLLLDVRLALALTIEPGFFHCLVACALTVSNSGVRVGLRSLA